METIFFAEVMMCMCMAMLLGAALPWKSFASIIAQR